MPENTLLGRCVAAFDDRHELLGPFDDDWQELCVAAVLQHLAAELVVMLQRDPRFTVHELARILRQESNYQPEAADACDDHPSLTVAERNPSLK
jgi:hypothetical protein